METIDAAKTEVKIWYNDKDISADVAPYLLSFEYNDFGSGQVDDLQVSFLDVDDRWCNGWYPEKGARLKADIVWSEGLDKRRLQCGEFVIDSPCYSSPNVITLKATSASVTTNLRRQKKTRQWKDITLKQLAKHIADAEGVKIFFYGPDTPPISKVLQKDKSDLSFLLDQCRKEGYALKVESGRLVVYKQSDIDGGPVALTIKRRGGLVLDFSFDTDDTDSYVGCKVRYKHPHKGLLAATYMAPGASEDGQILVVREHCGTEAEAIRRAKARLELANRNKLTCNMTHVGDVRFLSGVVVNLEGWGKLDGAYAIDEAKHGVGDGYKTQLKLAKVVR